MFVSAREAAAAVADPVSAAYLCAYLAWAGGDPQGALEAAEVAMDQHGADVTLLGLVVDLALVVGAERLAGARLRDLRAATEVAGMAPIGEGVLERLAAGVEDAETRGAIASAALRRAKLTAGAAAALLGLALLGVWRFVRSDPSGGTEGSLLPRSKVAV